MQVKQITADVTPILNTFSQGILQNPAAASVLNGFTTGPEVSAFVNQVQSLASLLSPNIQGLLVKQLRSHLKLASRPATNHEHDCVPVYLCTSIFMTSPGLACHITALSCAAVVSTPDQNCSPAFTEVPKTFSALHTQYWPCAR